MPDARGNAPSRIASVEEGRLPVTPSRSCLARTHARHEHETKKTSRIEAPGGLFPQPAPQQKHRVCCSLEQPYSRREANRTGESETVTKRIVPVREGWDPNRVPNIRFPPSTLSQQRTHYNIKIHRTSVHVFAEIQNPPRWFKYNFLSGAIFQWTPQHKLEEMQCQTEIRRTGMYTFDNIGISSRCST